MISYLVAVAIMVVVATVVGDTVVEAMRPGLEALRTATGAIQ